MTSSIKRSTSKKVQEFEQIEFSYVKLNLIEFCLKNCFNFSFIADNCERINSNYL